MAPRRPGLEVQRHRPGIDDFVAEPARGAPARAKALHLVAFPAAEAKGEGAVAEPRLRFIFGDEFLDHGRAVGALIIGLRRSEEHTSELQSLMRISYAVFCLKKKNNEKYQVK